MGTKTGSPLSLADALFPKGRQRVLGLLFGQPERSFFVNEIIGLAKIGHGAAQRELSRLKASALITETVIGRQAHYQANPASPLYHELTGIIRKTVGLALPLQQALAPLRKDIALAFVYGSVAKQTDTARSDIDLFIVSDHLDYARLYTHLQKAAGTLDRSVNPTIYSRHDLSLQRRGRKDSFISRVLGQPKVWLIGSDDDIPA